MTSSTAIQHMITPVKTLVTRGKYLVKDLLPVPNISPVTFAENLLRDGVDWALSRRDPMTPPVRWMYDGSRDPSSYKQAGDEFFGHLLRYCDLKPSDRVLDVGSGIGRQAIPLTRFLGASGSYEGFDIVPIGPAWCTKTITSKYPNFRFQRANVFNSLYNRKGEVMPSEYRFPFPEASFDLAIGVSLFTHMLPDGLENYLGEMSRILKDGGKCVATFLFVNAESLALQEQGRSSLRFKYDHGRVRTAAETAEGAVFYDEDYIRELLVKNDLALAHPILYGSWCGRTADTYQDIVVARKQKGAA